MDSDTPLDHQVKRQPSLASEGYGTSTSAALRADHSMASNTQSIAPPFSEIPVDILFSIFLAVLEDTKQQSPLWPGKHPIVSISHVSHEWRELSLCMPILWSLIHIDILLVPPNPTCPPWGTHLLSALEQRTKVFLSRSQDSPLILKITAPHAALPTQQINDAAATVHDCVDAVVKLVLPLSRRWKEFQSSMAAGWLQPSSPLYPLVTLEAERFPRLERIVLQHSNGRFYRDHADFELLQCPSLRNLNLKSSLYPFRIASVNWTRLTDLSLGDGMYAMDPHLSWAHSLSPVDMPLLVQALRLSPNLVHCSVVFRQSITPLRSGHFTIDRPTAATIDQPIHLPQLESLSFRGRPRPYGLSMAPLFNLPRLYSLCMLSSRSTLSDVEWGLKFGPQLTDVTLDPTSLERGDLLTLLKNMPNLIDLNVTHLPSVPANAVRATFDRAVWDRLTPERSGFGGIVGECDCPKLRMLRCTLPTIAGEEIHELEEALVEFIVARRKSVGRGRIALVKEVKLEFLEEVTIPASRVQETLRQRGVNIDLFTLNTSNYEQGLE